jgi:membrane protein implicated in regulation of membrane protease activity
VNESLAITVTMVSLAFVLVSITTAWLYYRYKSRAEAQSTVRAALEKGQELSPAVVEKLIEPLAPTMSRRTIDLRRGVILIAVGIAISVFGSVAAPSWREALALASLPLIIGLAYLGLWKFAPRD